MSPTHAAMATTLYTPVSDVADRREYGVTKSRRTASTGGGRAWSEEEETYLIRTRQRKMPYKHIAMHLNKSELACRLHYHQISHGSGRRRRAASCSSLASDHSPIQALSHHGADRPLSPPSSRASCEAPSDRPMQLPSMMGTNSPPRLPALLPKPSVMPQEHPQVYAAQQQAHMAAASMQPRVMPDGAALPLRLDLSSLPPPSSSTHTAAHVDLTRLHAIYAAHRDTFWGAVAYEYGHGASPASLEKAWKSGRCCERQQWQGRAGSPISPVESADGNSAYALGQGAATAKSTQERTSISSLLTTTRETSPRCDRDRDMVRRIDGDRYGATA